MSDLKNKLEEIWIQRGSFGYVVVKDKDSNPEWINRPIQVCSVSILYTLQEELQKTRDQLKKCETSLGNYAICNDVGALLEDISKTNKENRE